MKEYVSLKAYNIIGKEIATSIDEEMRVGEHKIRRDGQKYSSGEYFYKLKICDQSEIRKMVLVK
jgi:hypothetical protein